MLSSSNISCSKWNSHNESEVFLAVKTDVFALDLKSSKEMFHIQNAHETKVRCIDVNPNKPFNIVSGGDDCAIKFWDTRHLKSPIKQILHHSHWYHL